MAQPQRIETEGDAPTTGTCSRDLSPRRVCHPPPPRCARVLPPSFLRRESGNAFGVPCELLRNSTSLCGFAFGGRAGTPSAFLASCFATRRRCAVSPLERERERLRRSLRVASQLDVVVRFRLWRESGNAFGVPCELLRNSTSWCGPKGQTDPESSGFRNST